MFEPNTLAAKLKDSLLNGGLSQETLDILIYGSQPPPPKPYQQGDEHSTRHVGSNSPTQLNGSKTVDEYQEYSYHDEDDDEEEDGVIISQNSDEKDDYDDSSRSGGSYTASTGQRTILIRNLPDRAFHQDIVDAVRGGALLHIYIRSRERTANVSFVEETAAQEFLQHTKTYGLYLAGKRVEVSWSERQFYLPPYVRAKINNGASRNLVINNVNPNMTESHIRNDLEHIHNLIVISVRFQQGNAYISTNSVHNALFARSCMMSRFVYKGTRIGFYPDDCAEPLPQMPIVSKKDMLQVPPKKPVSALNRFHLLSLDGTEEEESDSYENIPDDLNGHPSLYGGICWADNSVYA
ncbi:hypothetical protein MW887_000288 [Aspergillus wentii]|nr:hypothetical protein MW887_000288 [Aspergillus wentii]